MNVECGIREEFHVVVSRKEMKQVQSFCWPGRHDVIAQ